MFRNISISNVTVSGAPIVVDIQGLPEMPIAGLRIRDLVGSGKRGLQAFNTKGLELRRCEDRRGRGSDVPDSRFVGRRVGSGGDGSSTDRMPVVRLDRVTRTLIQGSRAWPGTGTFLSAAPGLLKSVVLDANDLAAAKTQAEESSTDYWQGIDSPDQGLARR